MRACHFLFTSLIFRSLSLAERNLATIDASNSLEKQGVCLLSFILRQVILASEIYFTSSLFLKIKQEIGKASVHPKIRRKGKILAINFNTLIESLIETPP